MFGRKKFFVRKKRKQKKKRNDLDTFVFLAMAYIFGWAIAFFVAWCIKDIEPSILEGCILAPGIMELMCTTYIQTHKENKVEKEGLWDKDFQQVDIDEEDPMRGRENNG